MPNITITNLFRKSLESIMCCILHAKAAEIWEYDAHQHLSIIARMGHNFAFRTMSTTRRLLEIPGHKRYLFWDKIKSGLTFAMPFVNDTLVAPFACCQSKRERKGLLLVTLCAFDNLDANNLIFIHKLGSALASAHEWMSLRKARALTRKLTSQRITSMCLDHVVAVRKLIPALQTRVSQCFPQSCVRLGYLELGGDRITIQGKAEHRQNKSLEFDCLPPVSCVSLVVSNPAKFQQKEYLPGTRVHVRYGKMWYLAVIHLNRGHLTYDVTYDLKDWMGRPVCEAAVPIARLKHIPARQFRGLRQCQSKVKSTVHDDIRCWPYLLVPLGCMRGILYLGSWAITSPEPSFDELDIIGFLQTIGVSLGIAMDDKVRGGALRHMRSLTRNNASLSSKEIKKKMVLLLNECAMLLKSLLLYNLVDLHALFLPVSRNSIMTSLLLRCVEISSNPNLLDSTLLIESDAVYTVFLTVFDDTKNVSKSRKNSAVVTYRSLIFLSSKYSAITREDMAFCMKLSELAKVPLAKSSALKQLALLRIETLGALEALIKHKPANLLQSLHVAGTHISETVKLNVFIAYVLPDDGPIRIVWSSTKSPKARPSANKLLIKRRSKHLMFQCLITKQPIVLEKPDEAAQKLHYSTSIETKSWPWICAPVTTRGVLVLNAGMQSVDLSSVDFDFCESAATIIGSTIDIQCKTSELSALSRSQIEHCHGQHQVSTRDIYLRSLGAIYRQLSFPCRLSILQMRSRLFEDNEKYSSSGKCDVSFSAITLLLRLLSIQGLHKLVTPLVGIIYINNVETGRTYTKEQNPSCFESGLFSIPLRENWLSSRLRVEIWKVASEPGSLYPLKVARLIGSAELSGSYYLHLSDCPRAYPLVDTCYQPLSPSLRLLSKLSLQTGSGAGQNITALGPSTVSAMSTLLYQDVPYLHLIRASAESMLPQPGRYICVFYAEDGSEYGRTPTSPHTMCPEWNNLNISVTRTIYPTSGTLRVELWSTTGISHQVIGSAIVSGSSLIYLPRNLSKLRLRLTSPCKTPKQVGYSSQLEPLEQEYIIILLRFGRMTNDASKLNCNLFSYPVSVARLVNGILEFQTVAIAPDDHVRVGARSNAKTSYVVPFSDVAIRIGERIIGPAGGTCFVVVVACAPGVLGREHVSFINDVTSMLEANIRHLRHRELRGCARAHGFNQTLAVCKNWASISLPGIFNNALHISSQCLPGCCVYLSLLQPGGDELKCVASNTQSNMYGKRLLRGQGISFSCLEPATNNDIAVGLSTEHVHVFDQQNYGFPYVCVPLRHHRSRLGVLAIDTFEFVGKVGEGPEEHLEDEFLEFLMGLGAIVGRAIDLRRKCDSLASLHTKPFRSPTAILNMSLRAIFSNIVFAFACEFWQTDEVRKLCAIFSVKPASKTFLCGIWGESSMASAMYPYITDMLMGNLLDAIVHANRMEPKLIGKHCQMIIIPFIELSKCHALSLVLTRDFMPCDAAQSYIMAMAKGTQRVLIELNLPRAPRDRSNTRNAGRSKSTPTDLPVDSKVSKL